MGDESWNIPSKDLFDMITGVRGDIAVLTTEMQQTRADMRAYNGLRKDLSDSIAMVKLLTERVDALENELRVEKAKSDGRHQVFEGIRLWIPIVCTVGGGFITFLIMKLGGT